MNQMIKAHPANLCLLLACVVMCASSTTAALAQDSSNTWTICTRDLEIIEIIVTKANEDQIVMVDEFGVRRSRSIDDLFFAIPTQIKRTTIEMDFATVEFEDVESTWYITLIDGQVIRASVQQSDDADALVCTIMAGRGIIGEATIPLENILSITLEPSIAVVETNSDSIITLTGDVLTGFIESVGTSVSIASRRDALDIDLGQIQAIHFANIAQRVSGVYLSTIDHLSLRVSSFDFDFQHPLTLTIDGPAIGLGTNVRDVWMLDPDSPIGMHVIHPTQRLVWLSSIEPELVEPTGDRNWAPSPTILDGQADSVLSTIDLHSPVQVIYPVPKGSTRFACKLVAPINTWTDCVASVYAISYAGERTELMSQQLNREHPSESINVMLVDDIAKIEFHIDPGAFGPIQDRVLIVHPRVVVETR